MVRITAKAEFRLDESTREKTVNQYKLGETVGRGAFCKVKWAEDTSGNGYAMKVLSRAVMERRSVAVFSKESGASTISFEEAMRDELDLLKGLQHKHVIGLHEIIDDLEHQDMYVVYDGMVGGELMHFRSSGRGSGYEVGCDAEVAKKHWDKQLCCSNASRESGELAVFTESVARFLFPQMLEAVVFLHERGVIHKDLKPDNILLSLPLPASDLRIARKLRGIPEWPKVVAEDAAETSGVADAASEACICKILEGAGLTIKVCDFGCSKVADPPEHKIYDALGTRLFTPPECFELRDDGLLGKPRDVWSLGCTLFNMLYGRCPFWSEEDNMGLLLEILACELILPEGIISMHAMDLIRGLMKKEPSDRLTAVSALQHPFLRPPEPGAP